MKVGPFGVALRGEAPNRRVLRWLKTVVVSDTEKAQEDGAQSRRLRSLVKCRYQYRSDVETGAYVGCFGMSPAGAR